MTEVASLFAAGRLAILANAGPLVAPMTKAAVPRQQRAAAARARLAQRPAVDLAGARPRRREGRLGRPPRRHGREQNTNQTFTSISVRATRCSRPATRCSSTGRRQRRDPDRRHLRQPVQSTTAATTLQARSSRPTTSTCSPRSTRRSSALDHRAGDLPDRLRRVDRRGADAVQRPSTGQNARQRPGAADPDGGPRDRRAQRDRRQAADLLRLDGRLRHARQPEHEPGRPAGADLARHRLLRHGMSNIGGVDMRNNVTLFTASDFGRTITSNGDGTDHGWGSHHFVAGGAVNGGDIYGRFPQFQLNAGWTRQQRLPAGHLGGHDRRDDRQVVRGQRHQPQHDLPEPEQLPSRPRLPGLT